MNQAFRVTLGLATPIHALQPLTLDALLSAAVANALGLEGEATFDHIPLARTEGIFHGSSMFLGSRYRHETIGRIMALRGERDLSVHAFRPNGRQYVNVHTDKAKKYANKLSTYPGIRASSVYFYGYGDPSRTEHLLANFIPGIGKRASGGSGEIVSVSVTPVTGDWSWRLRSGKPARPLPIKLWAQLGGDPKMPTMPLAVLAPYWQSPKVEAVFPDREEK